jgi:hypothetical protein
VSAPAGSVGAVAQRDRRSDRHGHDWRIVAPWYRWALADGSDPGRAANAVRPALHKYVSTDFVKDFLSDPQRSVEFDPAIDVLQRVEPIPTAQLNAPDLRFKSLAGTRLVPTDTRKLFLAAHQRFYLIAIGLYCDRAGFPMVDPANVAEVGFVVRRRRVLVPQALVPQAATLVHGLSQARATTQVRFQLDVAMQHSRLLHPFRSSSRDRVAAPRAATLAAAREVELAKRRLRTWAVANSIQQTTEGWVPAAEGSFGSWVAMPDEPEELVERSYPMRLLRPSPDDPDHAAHDGTIYYAAIPTASDEITPDGRARFNELDTYEIRVFARAKHGNCPGKLVWSEPTRPFRLASFYDSFGSAQRPTEVRLPDFKELEASAAMPSVRMTQPAGSSLEFNKNGEIPTSGRVGGAQEICFFSIPLITIIAMFVLNLFLPIVMFVFGLWWMLKLKFCIPPSIEFEGDLAMSLNVSPPELELMAGIDIDVLPGTNPAAVANVLRDIFNPAEPEPAPTPPPPLIPPLDSVPEEWQVAERLFADPDSNRPYEKKFTNNALFQLALRNGYGKQGDGAPIYTLPINYTPSVTRSQVVHP